MSIRKTPICPFCNSEMKKEQGIIHYDGVILPTKTVHTQMPTGYFDMIEESINLNLYVCSQCRFVALWRGDP